VTIENSTLAGGTPAGSTWSRPDDRFVPIRACDLTAALADDAARFGCDRQAVLELAALLQDVLDRETGSFERCLTDHYARFNPDRETRPIGEPSQPTTADYAELQRQLDLLLDKANFERLNNVQIAQAVAQARSRRLRVRVQADRVEFLDLWVRGQGVTQHQRRNLWRPWRIETMDVPVFKRMVIVVRLKDDPHVLLKLFKDIPETDIEALLPHAEVTMSLVDRLKLLGTGAGTLGVTATKLMKIAVGVAALWKLLWIVLVGLGTLAVRAALGYRQARISRNWQRTQHLYFQNLGNNASALQLLVATVKQEEFKEALLGYLLSQSPSGRAAPAGPQQLKRNVEQYLAERFDVDVDFDVRDAQFKLRSLGLWDAEDGDRVLSMSDARAQLRTLVEGATSDVRILDAR